MTNQQDSEVHLLRPEITVGRRVKDEAIKKMSDITMVMPDIIANR